MTKQAAIRRLIKEVNFLGFKNLGDLVEDMELNPLAYSHSAYQAFRVYKENY